MPVLVQNSETRSTSTNGQVGLKTLLDAKITKSDCVELRRIAIAPGESFSVKTKADELGWLMVVSGEGRAGDGDIGASHILNVGPEAGVDIEAKSELDLLWATVPQAERFDPDVMRLKSKLNSFDWSREPVLKSEHDARTRVYMATPKLTGTTAIKAEMITYPPGTAAPEHHHVGAEHFQIILSGKGTAVLDGAVHQLAAGDVLYNYENEPHYFFTPADATEDFVFVEFFVPGACETVWSPGANACAWLPTGKDIRGAKPVRDIGHHVHGDDREI